MKAEKPITNASHDDSSTEALTAPDNGKPHSLRREEIELIKNTIAKGASDSAARSERRNHTGAPEGARKKGNDGSPDQHEHRLHQRAAKPR